MASKNTITLQFGAHEGRNIQGLVIPTAHLAGVMARHLIYLLGGDPGLFESYKPTISDPVKMWESKTHFVSVSLIETDKVRFSDGRMVDSTPAFDPTVARLEKQERIDAAETNAAGIPAFLLKDAPKESVAAVLDASTRLGRAFPGLADAVESLNKLGGRIGQEPPNFQTVKKDSEMGKIVESVFGTNTGRRTSDQPEMQELPGSPTARLEMAFAGVGSANPVDRLERQTGVAWPYSTTRVGYPKNATRAEKTEADNARFDNALFSLNWRIAHGAEYPAAELAVSDLFRISTNRLRELYDAQFNEWGTWPWPSGYAEQRLATQDGPDFYVRIKRDNEMDDDEFIVSYPHMVADDNDLAGAMAAREIFLREFIEYKMES